MDSQTRELDDEEISPKII